jgi:ABC-type transport system involved in multi-copper enzyme maturation permease subunit
MAMLFGHFVISLGTRRAFDYTAFADFSRSMLVILVTQHYIVLLIATPVQTAGAITDEKWRGTLQYLLVTELWSWEILIGKLIGRLYQVFLIALTPLPVICFLGVFGGLDLLMLFAIGVSSLVMAFAIGSMSLLASVVCRHTRDAVLGVYTVGALFFYGGAAIRDLLGSYAAGRASVFITWIDTALNCLDPLHPMGTGWTLDDVAERNQRLLASVAAWGTLGVVCMLAATLRLRGAYLRYLEHTSKHSWWPVLIVFSFLWTVFGLILLGPFLALTGQLSAYLEGTSSRPWLPALFLFLIGWNAIGLLPLLIGIAILSFLGKSKAFLDWMYDLLDRNWLTRRARIAGDPLRWKERHVEGVAPLAMLRRLPRWLGIVIIILLTTISSVYVLSQHLPPNAQLPQIGKMILALDLQGLRAAHAGMTKSDNDFYYLGVIVMLLAGLVIAIRCSGAVTGEREKNTWEALLLTPLETRQLIRSKLWGIIGASYPYLLAYAIPALTLAGIGGLGGFLWTLLWLGVTLLGMTFVGAAGLWCSVRSKSSWRSLLGTLGITYVGTFLLFCVASPVLWIIAFILMLLLVLADEMLFRQTGVKILTGGVAGAFGLMFDSFGIILCVTLAGTFVLIAWRFVVSAEYRVSVLERTKHWRDEPKHPRWSRYGREQRRREREYDDD